MRKPIVALAGLAALTAAILAVILLRQPTAPAAFVASATAPLPPPAPAAPEPAKTAAASRGASDLPTVEVATHPIHAVPDSASPMMGVTLYNRAGKKIASFGPAAAAPKSAVPLAPSFDLSGLAKPAGATTIAVAGYPVKLFGIAVAGPRDRCGPPTSPAQNCAKAARAMLARRLRLYPKVSCRLPPDRKLDAGAICLDGSGTDLGGMLVSEGVALADPQQSNDYLGAQGVAQSFRRGLWLYR
jgi:endonuclease YncB( thermonuclease family)